MFATGLVEWGAYRATRSMLVTQIHERMQATASGRQSLLRFYVERQRERVTGIASRPRLLQQWTAFDAQSLDAAEFRREAVPALLQSLKVAGDIRSISLLDRQATVILSTDERLLGKNFVHDDDCRRGQSDYHLGLPRIQFSTDSGEQHYEAKLTGPAHNAAGELLGQVMILLDADPLVALLTDSTGLGETGEVVVGMPHEAQIHYVLPPWRAPGQSLMPADQDRAMQRAIRGEQGVVATESQVEPPTIAAYRPVGYRDWGLVARIDQAEAYAPVMRLRLVALSLTGLMLVGGAALSYFLARRLTTPILKMVRTANEVAGGDLNARVSILAQDELGQLAAAINFMTEQLAASQALLEQRVEQRTRELERAKRTLEAEVAGRKQAQEEAYRAREEAESASRAKSEFLASMSHEIRTPMNGILGMTELTLETTLTHEQREYLEIVKASADSLLVVINDILDFSKIEARKLQLESLPFGLRDTLSDTIRSLALRAQQKQLELALQIPPDVPDALIGDAGRLRQVIVNLVGNAIKFTEQGEVLVSVEVVRQSPAPPATEPSPQSSPPPTPPPADTGRVELHFQVADTGIGIPSEKHRKIFEAFAQVDSGTQRKYGGTGLGLAISARLAELMGGRIWVESGEGQGSRFHFTVRFGLSPQPVAAPGECQHDDCIDLPVLVVDDNATNRRILDEMLRGWQMKPQTVADGEEALDALRAAADQGRPFRLALLDAHMPGIDGLQLAEKIMAPDARLGSPIVLLLTSAGHRDEIEHGRQLGIFATLMKPIKQSELLEVILLALRHPAVEGVGPTILTPPAMPPPGTNDRSLRRLRILLAEDNEVNQTLAQRLLERRGHQVVIARNGRETLDRLAATDPPAPATATEPPYDLVLMDVQMPELDGLEATRQIRARERQTGRHLPIIAMTAYAMKGDREMCLKAGMDDYVAKPIKPQELFAAMSALTPVAVLPTAGNGPNRPGGGDAHGEPTTVASSSPAKEPPVFDKAQSLARMGGDPELLKEIASIFRSATPEILGQLREAFERRDAAAVRRHAHTLKGAVASLGGGRAEQAAWRLEQLSRDNRLHDAGPAYQQLLQAIEHLLAALAEENL